MNTPQEQVWAGTFGDSYTDRNMGRTPANRAFFRKVCQHPGIQTTRHYSGVSFESALELGCGAGENLQALRQLFPQIDLAGVEINPKTAIGARARLQCPIYTDSILDFKPTRTWELAFTKGLLIHIPPTELERAYETLVLAASRWVLVAEYYNPQPVEVPYRGEAGLLWKRDFAGELLARYQELSLFSYGWVYHRDPYPQDDLTWFLLEKRLPNPDAGIR
jgi:pseudaminic acid biosynthesis-associated methylase